MRSTSRARWAALGLALCFGSSPGCQTFDATRRPAPRGTLGEEIVRVFCERIASEAELARPEGEPRDVSGERWKPVCRGEEPPPEGAPPRLVALMENRARLAEALDQTLPEDLHDGLGNFLGELMPMFDPPRERIPQATRLLSDLLATLSADDAALEAMSRLGARTGYRPLRLGLGVVRPLLAYPEIDTFVDLALRTLTDLPSDASDGLAADEFRAVHTALAMEMAGFTPAEPLPPGERSTLSLTRELMFRSDPRFGTSTGPRWALLRDERGIAALRGETVVAPFVDVDADGLADVDDLGRFVGAGGGRLDVPPPFAVLGELGVPRDGSGRAIDRGAMPFFAYLDADDTMAAGVVREAAPWFDRDAPTLLQLSRALPALLGTDADRTATYGGATLAYEGWDTTRSSAIDMVYALSALLPRGRTGDLLDVLTTLVEEHESAAAGVVYSSHYLLTRSELYPGASLRQPNSLWDDMIELAIRLDRRPGMLEAVLRSFADPDAAQLGDLYGNMMRFRDRITYDPANPNGAAIGLPLDEPVDRSMPDVEGNESLVERSVALIDGLNGVRVCNRDGARLDIRLLGLDIRYPLFGTARECELIDIPNVAEAYALSILGRYELEIQDGFLNGLLDFARVLGVNVDDVLEESSGIEGLTTRPTPEALNRLVFWALDDDGTGRCDPSATGTAHCNSAFASQVFDRVLDRHGNDVIDTYEGTIFAWEQPGFYEGMTPLLTVLEDPRFRLDAEGNYAFGNIIETIWIHWPTRSHWLRQSDDPSAPNYVPGNDARSYELLLADGFVDGRFVANLQLAAAALDGIPVGSGDGLDVLAEVASDLLNPDRSPGLTTRDGRATVPRNDGGGTMAVTPILLFLEALRNVDRDLATLDPEVVDGWRAGRDALARQLLDTRTLGSGYAFTNQRGRAIVVALLPFLAARWRDHRDRGDLTPWAAALPGDAAEFLDEPLVAGLIRLLDVVNADPEARGALVDLLGYLVDEGSDHDAFLAMVFGLIDLLQVLEDDRNIVPLLHALSGALAPNARSLVAGTRGEPDVEGSVGYDALTLLREVRGFDRDRTLRDLLGNLVQLRGDETTPLEVILDVASDVNRAEPGAGGSYEPPDYRALYAQMTGFLDDSERGVERLYDVVQARELDR
jgi:hypothetical protein